MPVSDLDCAVEEEFIFEIDSLFKREKSHMNIEFTHGVEIEEVSVIEVEP